MGPDTRVAILAITAIVCVAFSVGAAIFGNVAGGIVAVVLTFVYLHFR